MQERLIDMLALARKYVPSVKVHVHGDARFACIFVDMTSIVRISAVYSPDEVGGWAVDVRGPNLCFSVKSEQEAKALCRVLATQADLVKWATAEEFEEIQNRAVERFCNL